MTHESYYITSCKTFKKRMNKIISLVLILFFLASCKKEKQIESEKSPEKIEVKKDSLSISLEMPAKTSNGLNVWVKPYDEFYLEFKNNSKKDSTIIKKIPFFYDYYQMSFGAFKFDENKNFERIKRHFIASQKFTDFELKFESNLIEFKNKTPQSILTDSIYKSYKDLRTKHFKNKSIKSDNYLKELDSLNAHFKKLKTAQTLNYRINEILYLDEIQKINPNDKRIKKFLENSDEILIGGAQIGILFNYFKNNAETLNYEELNTEKYTSTYIELLAIGAYRFLKFEDNKGDTKYNKAVSWLKTTDFYKRDSTHIKKQITPLSNEIFQKHLSKLTLLDIDGKQISISEIISQNKTQYYLIDFWATWCAPCIQGVKTMNKMNIPKNIKVISLSVDKEKDKKKWKIKTKELKQEFTYWFNEQKTENKGFTEFIEMQSIPRYILIDNNMNLIDQAFYHPHEPQFLSKLRDIKNHKYW